MSSPPTAADNEIILDESAFAANVPDSISAVFFLPTICEDAHDGPKCEDYARGAHRNLLRTFGLTEARLPLVRFDFFNWDQPFSSAPNCDPTAAGVTSCGPAASAAPLDSSYRVSQASEPGCLWGHCPGEINGG
eukprot:5490907-Prymnesium_polylepis.1